VERGGTTPFSFTSSSYIYFQFVFDWSSKYMVRNEMNLASNGLWMSKIKVICYCVETENCDDTEFTIMWSAIPVAWKWNLNDLSLPLLISGETLLDEILCLLQWEVRLNFYDQFYGIENEFCVPLLVPSSNSIHPHTSGRHRRRHDCRRCVLSWMVSLGLVWLGLAIGSRRNWVS